MKTISGAILMFASAVCVLAAATVYDPLKQDTAGFSSMCAFAGVVHFLLGLYFLFFEKDKPSN